MFERFDNAESYMWEAFLIQLVPALPPWLVMLSG
jgi:hypothetical protein